MPLLHPIMFLVFAFLLMLDTAAHAGEDPPMYATEHGAMDGYDPVAMLEANTAVRGDAAQTFDWANVTWSFASAENRERFAANPQRYAPQYGGFCAVGMTHGGLIPTDPTTFNVRDGKLYLNLGNLQKQTWLRLQDGMQPRADSNWARRMRALTDGVTPAPGGFTERPASPYALAGMDVVSYFSGKSPVAGRDAHVSTHEGRRYRFASASNQGQFDREPARYLPQYGGNCVIVMAHDFAMGGDPTVHVLHRDKLYLLLGDAVRTTFLADPDWFIARADGYFAKQVAAPTP